MRIAINALAMRRHPHGVGTYIKQLVRCLAALDAQDDFLLLVSRENRDLLAAAGPNFHYELAPSMRPLRLLWEQAVMPSLLARRRVDVFHGATFALPLRKTSRQVLSIHDMTFFLMPDRHTFAKRMYFRRMIPRACRQADAIIAVSENTRKDVISLLGVPEEKVHVVYHGVPDNYQPVTDEAQLERVRRQYALPPRFILCVGMLEPRKNLATLVEAYRLAPALQRDCALVLAGGLGWGYRALLRQISDSGIKSIHLPGYIPEQDLPAVYSMASLFVYPSLYEGFGLPVLEAMACGLPVVTSNVSSLPEITGGAAVLIEPRDAPALGQAMRDVLADTDTRQRMRAAGLARARCFTWEETARKTLAIYRSTMHA